MRLHRMDALARMSSSEFPRVLVLSDEGPQTGSAGGLLLHRLFHGWPADRIRVLARHVPTRGDPLPNVAYRRLLVPWHRFENSRWHRLKRSLRAFGLTPMARMADIAAALEGFSPDLVFCVMQHAQYFDSAAYFARSQGLPLVVAVHDLNESFEPVYPWAREAMRQRDRAFYRLAACRLCISPEMERYCREAYGVAGEVLLPIRSDDLEPRPLALAATLRTPGRLTLGFVGNLGYGYGQALEEQLDGLRAAGARLIVYSRPPGPELQRLLHSNDCCDLRGFVPAQDAWRAMQAECDAVWLPYPKRPDDKLKALYRVHFPSKLPEYLALGLPVLVTGPQFATGVRWAEAHSDAVVTCTLNEPREFSLLLARLAQDAPWRLALAENAVRVGDAAFSPEQIRSEFRRHLRAVSKPSR